MLFLLIAAQLATTNCIPDANGGVMCTTVSAPQPPPIQMPPMQPMPDMSQTHSQRSSGGCGLCNLISILDASSKKRHAKAVGNMLAKGECAGAEQYALQKGDLDLADRVKARCVAAATESAGTMPETIITDDPTTTPVATWQHLETVEDGTAIYADPQSLHDEGAYHSFWMRVVYPAANSIRETRVLNFYRCQDQTNAVKMFVDYFRDGNVQSQTVKERELKFEPLVPETPAEMRLFNAACAPRSASK